LTNPEDKLSEKEWEGLIAFELKVHEINAENRAAIRKEKEEIADNQRRQKISAAILHNQKNWRHYIYRLQLAPA
jgi:hypothetical protein